MLLSVLVVSNSTCILRRIHIHGEFVHKIRVLLRFLRAMGNKQGKKVGAVDGHGVGKFGVEIRVSRAHSMKNSAQNENDDEG